MADKKKEKNKNDNSIDDKHVERSWSQIIKDLLTTDTQKEERMDADIAFFAEVLGLNPEYMKYGTLENLSPLISYANIKTSDSAIVSTKLGPPLKISGDFLWSGGYVKEIAQKAFNAMSELIGRENHARAVFGLPYAYLPAVDPYGRVYKDLFGVRSEEAYIQKELVGSTVMSNESKFFSAFIRVGMLTQAKGNSLISKILDTTKATLGNSDGPIIVSEKFKEEMKKFKGDINAYIANAKQKNSNVNETILRKTYDEYKKMETAANAKISDAKSEKSTIVTSFGLVYYVEKDIATEMGRGGDGLYKPGQIVPFAAFAFNALQRVLNSHRDLGYAYVKLCEDYIVDIFQRGSSLPFYKFICTEESIVNETIQNQIGDSFIKGLIDKSSDISRELSFISGGANAVDIAKQFAGDVAGALGADNENKGTMGTIAGALASGFKSMADFAVGGADAIFGKDLVDMILKGNSLIYPRVWKGSSVETMASLQMRFYSPYGNFASIFNTIIVPLTVLLGISLPRQVYPSFVSYPFAFSIDVPGLFTTQMAIVTNIAVKRGGRYDAWNNASMMRGVDITLDVTPLKPLMGFPEEGKKATSQFKEAVSDSIYGDMNRKGDITFANYIRSMAGDFAVTDTTMLGNIEQNLKRAVANQVSGMTAFFTKDISKAVASKYSALMTNFITKSTTDNKNPY